MGVKQCFFPNQKWGFVKASPWVPRKWSLALSDTSRCAQNGGLAGQRYGSLRRIRLSEEKLGLASRQERGTVTPSWPAPQDKGACVVKWLALRDQRVSCCDGDADPGDGFFGLQGDECGHGSDSDERVAELMALSWFHSQEKRPFGSTGTLEQHPFGRVTGTVVEVRLALAHRILTSQDLHTEYMCLGFYAAAWSTPSHGMDHCTQRCNWRHPRDEDRSRH